MRLGRFIRRHGFDLVVLTVAVVVQIEVWSMPVAGPKLAVVPGMLLATLPLLLRRRFPFAAPACVFAALVAMTFAHPEAPAGSPTLLLAVLLAFWSVGAHAESHQAVAGLLIGLAAMVVVIERDPTLGYAEEGGHFLVAAGVWLAGFVLGRRARRAAELEERAGRLERERGERERAAVAQERRRIARDLHDVVAHSVSVMTVQAGAARLLLEEDPGRARAPLVSVEETGRQALGEMRRLVGILRREEGEAALAAQPGLARLDELVAQARGGGLPVELTVEGERTALPPGIDLAAYRIVQEALTNARKHAGPARAKVALRYESEALEVEIVDDGRVAARGDGSGHGLVGMRERVALYGGEFDAGPRTEGGYAVHARLPLEPRRAHGTVPSGPSRRAVVGGSSRGFSTRLSSSVTSHLFDALVVLLAVLSEVEIWLGSVPGPRLVTVPAVLLYTLPLLLRHRYRFAAPVFVFAVQAAISFADEAVGGVASGFAALLLGFWAVGAGNARNQAIAGLAIGLATLAVIGERDVRVEAVEGANGALVAAAVWLVAFVLGRRTRRAAELERRAARLEHEREERERTVVALERRRIARDLHDVVARSVNAMAVQAGAARLLLDVEPERAREPIIAVEETGRLALGEMRRLLGILREDEAEAGLAPQPGLARLDELLAQARSAGLPIELTVEGEPRALPRGIDLAAYRIVQEALTNARNHAGPARAQVTIRYEREALELDIADDGRRAQDSGANGLVGMRERVALYGGKLEAGPRAGDGYSVHARLPLEPTEL